MARRAVELDPNLAEAHAALGFAKLAFEWYRAGAEQELQEARELNPTPLSIVDFSRYWLCLAGRWDEAVDIAEHRESLDPNNPQNSANVGRVHFYARRYDDAIAQLRKAIPAGDSSPSTLTHLKYSFIFNGDCSRGMELLAPDTMRIGAAEMPDSWLVCACEHCGRHDLAPRLLEQARAFAEQHPPCWNGMAGIYAAPDDKDNAFAWLRKGLEVRQPIMPHIVIEPIWDGGTRSHPRWQELMGLIEHLGAG